MRGLKQKFMIGLPLAADLNEWGIFLDEYKNEIETVYFSVPLGRKYHSRLNIAKQFEDEGMIDHFFDLIYAVMQKNIKLELVLNTDRLDRCDIISAYEFIIKSKIKVDSVSCLNCYYAYVKTIFKDQEINYSYNNFFNNINELKNNRYNSVIIGRYNIRNTALFKQLYERNIKVILLLNNGCSHRCGWCHDLNHCKSAFDKTKNGDSVDYLYAEQSLMPFEINDGLLDTSCIYAFKINNRNADLNYLKSCIDSYMLNDNTLHNDVRRWALWGKLGWFSRYYSDLSLKKVIEEKQKIYNESAKKYMQLKKDKMKEYNIVLNLCDEYSIFCDFNFEELTNNVYAELYSKFGNYKFSITEVRVGCETCCNLFGFIKKEKLLDRLRRIKSTNVGISFVFPVVAESNYSLCCDLLLYLHENKAIDRVVVNDYGMLALCREYRVNVILGRTFDKRLRDPRVHSDLFMNGSPENLGVFSQTYLKMYKKESISAMELDCLELGIGQDIPEELETIYLHYPYRYITSGRICEFGGIGKDNYNKFKIGNCSMQCMKFVAKSQTPPLKSVIYKHCNAIFEKVRLTDNIINDFINPKVNVIYTPEFTGRKI